MDSKISLQSGFWSPLRPNHTAKVICCAARVCHALSRVVFRPLQGMGFGLPNIHNIHILYPQYIDQSDFVFSFLFDVSRCFSIVFKVFRRVFEELG